MKMQLASDERGKARQTAVSIQVGGEDVLALSEERELRRIEFRSSLLNARTALARMESTEMTRRSMRELSAGLKERRPARMMQELVNAH